MSEDEEDDEVLSISDTNEDDQTKKKDKKLVFLSRSVLEKVREKPMTTGTQVSSLSDELCRLLMRF